MPAPINCSRSYNREELAKFSQFIRNQYRIHWILDNMPAAQPIITAADPTHSQGYSIGFALGYRDEAGSYFLNNHYSITIRYRVRLSLFQFFFSIVFDFAHPSHYFL